MRGKKAATTSTDYSFQTSDPSVNPTSAKVVNVLAALQGEVDVPSGRCSPPCWLRDGGPEAREILACRNGLLHLPTDDWLLSTSSFFTRNRPVIIDLVALLAIGGPEKCLAAILP